MASSLDAVCCWRRQSRELGARMLEIERQALEQSGAAVRTFELPEADSREILFDKHKLPVLKNSRWSTVHRQGMLLQELALNSATAPEA